jgi:hypothetical protein
VGKATTDTLTNKTLTSPTMTAPVLGTPASGTVTNLTGTASININGTVGATTPAAGSFTTVLVNGGSPGAVTAPTNADELVIQNAAAAGLTILTPDANAARIYFGTASNNANALIYSDYNAGSQLLIFGVGTGVTGATERARITSTGLNSTVIGATTPAAGTFTSVSAGSGAITGGAITSTVNGAGVNKIRAYNSNNNATDGSGVEFGKSAADPFARVWSNHNSGTLYFDTLLNFPFEWRQYMTGSPVTVMSLSSTGLAVTGTLSATGLLDLSAATAGQIKFPATQNASADANTLDDYDEYTAASAACTGAITTAAIWKLTKVGNMVTLTLPAVTGTASAAPNFTFGTVIPAKYRPTANNIWLLAFMVENNVGLAPSGRIQLYITDGSIIVWKDAAQTNFGAYANTGLVAPVSVSWTI